jgi:exosortase
MTPTPALAASAKTETKSAHTALAIFGLLILACYAPAVRSLVRDWMTNENMGHGFFVPVVAGYLLWQQRDQLAATPATPNWWGLPIVRWGAMQSMIGTLGAEMFFARSALIATLAGTVWLIWGTEMLKKTAFPLFLLCFMVPFPAVIFNSVTFPLQLLASRFAEFSLDILGVPVMRQGNVLELPSGPLSVVEACSGIRSLLSLTFLSLVYGRFFETRTWVRVLLFVSTVPIAILANGGRVTITGLLSLVNPELAKGVFHESTGWVIFMLALAILLLFHKAVGLGIQIAERRSGQ